MGLVDAEGVDPEGYWGETYRRAKVLEGGVQVVGDGVVELAVEGGGEAVGGVAPNVREGGGGGPVGEVDDVASADEGVAARARLEVEETDFVFGPCRKRRGYFRIRPSPLSPPRSSWLLDW